MSGFEVLHPIGWDAFGLPAENAAIKSDSHPAKWTYANIEKQAASFKRMGFSYDWDRDVVLRRGLLPLGPVDLPEVLGARAGRAQELAGQLVPELQDRARQRAGPRRRRVLALQERGREARARAVVLQDHRVRPGAPRRPRRAARLARARQDDAGELDRPQRGRRGRLRAVRRGRRADRRAHHGLHHAARHAVRLHVLPARARASARRASSSRAPSTSRRVMAVVDAPRARPRSSGSSASARRTARSRAATSINPVNGEKVPVWVSRLRADGVRHRCGHGGPLRRPARLRVRAQVRAADPAGRGRRGRPAARRSSRRVASACATTCRGPRRTTATA